MEEKITKDQPTWVYLEIAVEKEVVCGSGGSWNEEG